MKCLCSILLLVVCVEIPAKVIGIDAPFEVFGEVLAKFRDVFVLENGK